MGQIYSKGAERRVKEEKVATGPQSVGLALAFGIKYRSPLRSCSVVQPSSHNLSAFIPLHTNSRKGKGDRCPPKININ